ncbi:hypothetical protein ABTZ59_27740 [Streptomyces sp. NPDC094034]|uniref:hypothetical protein n=1 Tax=Streptomyces sp. NPDC094034 TaxID=3155309 RepID=UPI0033312AF4
MPTTEEGQIMKYYGVVYDVGYRVLGEDPSSVEPFVPDVVRNDMRVIAHDLHANAVRVEGEDLDRLMLASRAAIAEGLAVFFSPWKMNVDLAASKQYVAEAAALAEQLRQDGADIVFITNCEYSIFCDGVYPGSDIFERSAWAKGYFEGGALPLTPQGLHDDLSEPHSRLNDALRELAATVRESFHGPVTYSAASFEDVDWTIFDLTGPNFYRERQSDEEYLAGLEYYRSYGNPVIVPEFGSCTYVGAADLGARGWRVVEDVLPDGSAVWQNGTVPTRSEREQADYIERQLTFYEEHDVHAAFVFIFSQISRPRGEGPRDLDLGSYALVRFYPPEDPRAQDNQPWERKESFHRVAEMFQKLGASND